MEKHIEILVDRKECITKEEAYKAINEQYHETGLDGYQDGIELMNRIAKIPAADVIETHKFQSPCWIPITERLPKPYTAVLAAFDDGEVWCVWQRWSVNKDKDPFAYSTGADLDVNVTRRITHWMPFPEPPKEE